MEDHVEKFRQADALAQNILRLTRNTLLVNLRFLDLALSQFQLTSYPGTLATDGQHLFYDTYYVLSMYKRERGRNVRDYLHIVLHCVFRHLFTSANIDRRCWDLACDIAVESAIEDLHLESAACNRAYAQEETLKELRSQVRLLTAEKLYRYFLDRQLSDDQMARLRDPFLADDHRAWYLPVKSGQGAGGGSQSSGRTPETGTPGKQKSGRGGQGSRAQTPKSGTERRDKDLEQTWKEISERLQVDLETISRRHGTDAGNLVQELKAVNRETYDYADFLRRYMSLGEVTQVNQDEFDYIYYTYGLSLYGNMPLVEPLEYKEVRRIKEFVIAIDTSASTKDGLVRRSAATWCSGSSPRPTTSCASRKTSSPRSISTSSSATRRCRRTGRSPARRTSTTIWTPCSSTASAARTSARCFSTWTSWSGPESSPTSRA